MRARLLILIVALAAFAVTSCSSDEDTSRGADTPETAADAAVRSGFVLPPGTKMLGFSHLKAIDERWAFAFQVAPGEVDDILKQSSFTAPLNPGGTVLQKPVIGVDVAAAKKTASAQDRYPGGANPIVRDVLLITDDPNITIVHVWAYTT